jgi:hypothetical protein
MQHRPQHGGVEPPPGQRAEQADVAGANDRDGISHGCAEDAGCVAQAEASAGRARSADRRIRERVRRRGPASSESECECDGHRGAGRGHSAQREWPVAVGEAERQRAAGRDDGPEENRVQHDEEREQRARGIACAQAGAPEGPDRQRRASDATRGEQARGRGPAEGELGARAQSQPRGGAAADEPQQRDVAGERQQLEDGGGPDPSRIGIQRTVERIREGPQRAARHGDHYDGHGHERGGQRRPARQRAEVDGRKGELG